jgi:teichuronic acid biosynthesis glycosyltransferase TuaC
MRICFVIEGSPLKSADGVLTVVESILRNWNSRDELLLMMNKTHWAYNTLASLTFDNNNVFIEKFAFHIPFEIFDFNNNTIINKILYRLYSFITCPIYIYIISLWLRNNNIQSIISHNGGWPGGELNRWFVFAGRFCNLKKVILVIHSLPSRHKFSLKIFNDIRDYLTRSCCHEIVTVSYSCLDHLISNPKLGKYIRVVANGLNLTAQKHKSIACPWVKKYTTIGYVGHITHRKGVHILISSLKHLKYPCEIVLIGSSDAVYLDKLKSINNPNDVPIHYLGYREDAKDLINYIDVLVLPSIQHESFGMVILEAMQKKVPVICSDVGGMKEVVQNNVTGFVVEKDDILSLSTAINMLLNDEKLRLQFGNAGYRRLLENFTTDKMIRAYEAILKI